MCYEGSMLYNVPLLPQPTMDIAVTKYVYASAVLLVLWIQLLRSEVYFYRIFGIFAFILM